MGAGGSINQNGFIRRQTAAISDAIISQKLHTQLRIKSVTNLDSFGQHYQKQNELVRKASPGIVNLLDENRRSIELLLYYAETLYNIYQVNHDGIRKISMDNIVDIYTAVFLCVEIHGKRLCSYVINELAVASAQILKGSYELNKLDINTIRVVLNSTLCNITHFPQLFI